MLKDKNLKNMTLKQALCCITYTVVLIIVAMNYKSVFQMLKYIFALLRPFIYGFCMAYVIYLPMRKIETILPQKLKKGRNLISGILAIVAIVCIIVFILKIVIPQFANSIVNFSHALPSYIAQLQHQLNVFMKEWPQMEIWLKELDSYTVQIQNSILASISSILPSIISIGKGITSTITTLFMAIIIAVYLLVSKRQLCRQINQVMFAFLPQSSYVYLKHVGKQANQIFASFISGQLIEAIIIGVLCYIGASFLQIPYVPILAVIIAITNIIPIFGPIIGTVICACLILFISPIKAVIFVVFGIALQQFESNLIYPRVVGSSVGLSGLWTLFAITISGGIFGLIGMVIGLPCFALFYTLLKEEVQKRIKEKELTTISANL